MRIGNRVPRDYFVTSGVGLSELTVHAGSYHMALRDAGIERANIMTYSSILPRMSQQVPRPDSVEHGEVMETIMAVSHARYGEMATAGIRWGWLYDARGAAIGGLVAEYSGSMPEEQATEHLDEIMKELHKRGGFEEYELRDTRTLVRSVTPMQMYGTALVALCFTGHEVTECA